MMATAVVARQKLRADDIFFSAMAVLILGIVVTGFAHSYFFAGMLFAKLPNTLVHIHGALFVSWIFLLLLQASLVAAHRVKWHMTLGTLGFILPPLMVLIGVLTLFDSIRRNQLDIPPELLLIGDLENLFLFIVLISWGILARRDASSTHRNTEGRGSWTFLGAFLWTPPNPFTTLAIWKRILLPKNKRAFRKSQPSRVSTLKNW